MQEFFSTLNIPNTKFNFKTEREGQTIKIVDVEHIQGEAGPKSLICLLLRNNSC